MEHGVKPLPAQLCAYEVGLAMVSPCWWLGRLSGITHTEQLEQCLPHTAHLGGLDISVIAAFPISKTLGLATEGPTSDPWTRFSHSI